MESSYREYSRFIRKPGKIHMSKSEYLNLVKQPLKSQQVKNITLHQSLKIYYNNDDKKILSSRENESSKKSFNISLNKDNRNNNQKESQRTPQKSMKKVVVKSSINFPNKIKGRIIYKNSRNESPINKPIRSSLNNNKKILNKNIDNENKNIVNNNNNDKETITTSTTTPITTPVKGTNELIKNINSDNSVSLSGGNNINKKLSHYEKNKLKFPNYFNNFKKYESNLVKDKKKLEFPFQKILSRNESAKSNNTYSFNFQNLTNTNNNSNNNINNNNINKNSNNIEFDIVLNIEDLIMIEDKFSKLMKNVNEQNFHVVNKSCYEWWNFYFNCTLKGNCDYLFGEPNYKSVITCHNTLLLISIMLVYDISFKSKFFMKLYDIVKKILYINHQNFLTICQFLISKIKQEYLNSKWVEQLKEIISSNIKKKEFYFYDIEHNIQSLNQYLSMIILKLNTSNNIINPKIQIIYKKYNEYDSDSINKIFMSNILQIDNQGGSLLFSSKKFNNPKISDYFLKKQSQKTLTLVLDLDETLMSFVYINNEKKEGILRLRPFLYNFLNLVKEYYEIIIFTAATQTYADPILDVIEVIRGKYFNYRLYREHCSIFNNVIVKDISLIGRNINHIIIVDNMQQNFKLQKKNGILISSFWGDDTNDKALLHLGKILVNIATNMIEFNYNCDVRDEIKKYKDDILKNVSMS